MALKTLLRQRERDKLELEAEVIDNVKELVRPYIEKLRSSKLDRQQAIWLDSVEFNLRRITADIFPNVKSDYFNFTPKEQQVVNFIKNGLTSKEIARRMEVSESAIQIHRYHIRKKLDMSNKKINLQSYLVNNIP